MASVDLKIELVPVDGDVVAGGVDCAEVDGVFDA